MAAGDLVNGRDGDVSMPRVVCIGETIVDLICDEEIAAFNEAESFGVHLGGELAVMAVTAARLGAGGTLLTAVGEDPWGRWLQRRLVDEPLELKGFRIERGLETPHVFRARTRESDAAHCGYGAPPDQVVGPTIAELLELIERGPRATICFGVEVLTTQESRSQMARALKVAREAGWRTLFDASMRPGRPINREHMLAAARGAISGASVVKVNRSEARLLTRCDDLNAAATSLVEAGADVAMVYADDSIVASGLTTGPERFPIEARAGVDPTGAAAAAAGVVATALAASPHALDVESVMPVAAAIAAGVADEWGSLAGLPGAETGRSLMTRALGGRSAVEAYEPSRARS